MAQLVAERLHESIDRVHVSLDVNTRKDPEHWKTVASSSVMLSGRAVLQAADDAIRQIKEIGAVALRAAPDDLAVARGRVFLRSNPAIGMPLEKVVHGYRFPNGNAIGGHVVGHGHYLMHRVTRLEHETGQGKPGPEWTVGAEAIEVELDLRDCTYRLVRAAAVIDAGRVLHPHLATGQVMGGMHMGLSFGSREHFVYSERGVVLNPQFRSYKLLHYGEHPEYLVDFVERPYLEGPLGARGVGEYGLIGMPAALANALSVAAGVELYRLPLLPEQIWRARGGDVR